MFLLGAHAAQIETRDRGNSRRVEEVGTTGQGRMSRWKLGFSCPPDVHPACVYAMKSKPCMTRI